MNRQNSDFKHDHGGGRSKNRRYGEGNNRRQGEGINNRAHRTAHRTPMAPLLSISEIKEAQQEKTMANFCSSELTYNGSDRIVFITDGERIRTIWKKFLKREKPLNQDDIRIFISSALFVTASHQSSYEVEDLVTELGNPEGGLKRLRGIINFPSMSCDAGLQREVLSFQHVILPLLGLLTRTAITECILEKHVHAIFMVVYNDLVSIMNGTV